MNKIALVIVLIGTVLVVFATTYIMGALSTAPNASESESTDKRDKMAKVTTAPDIFDQMGERWEDELGEGWETSPHFLIVTEDADKAAAGLQAASPRLFRVNGRGQEVDLATHDPNDYTPNWVSDVYITSEGLVIYVDTKGDLPKGMADTMLRIVVEELLAADASAHVTAAPADWEVLGTYAPAASGN
ncbi:hypothetical protein GCM10009712_14460 [Pseudarthrobacter sulfonivorans]